MCKIEGCDGPVFAAGLCAKHYFRQRRHGDANTVAKRGRAVSPALGGARQMLTDLSDRTQRKFATALEQLHAREKAEGYASGELVNAAVRRATRPNGSLNVSLLARIPQWLAYLDEHPEDAPGYDEGDAR